MSGSDAAGLLGGSGEVVVGDDHFTKQQGFPTDIASKLTKFKDVAALSTGYMDFQNDFDARGIMLPKDDASDEDKKAQLSKIHTKLGRPEKAEDYKIEQPANLPEGLAWSPEVETEAKAWAHGTGINNAQLQSVVNLYTGIRTKEIAGIRAAQDIEAQEATAALKLEWGDSKFEVNLAASEKALQEKVPAPLIEKIKRVGLNNDPLFVKWMLDIYTEKIGEGTIVPGEGGGGTRTGKYLDYSRVDN